MANKKVQGIEEQKIENVPEDFVEPTRPVKLVAINRIEYEKPEKTEDTTTVLIGRGLVALLEDRDVKGEYIVIGNSCSCNGFEGGWKDMTKSPREIVLAPKTLSSLTFSERFGIGRYTGKIEWVRELDWQTYKTIRTGYPEHIKIKEIEDIGSNLIHEFAKPYVYDGAFHIQLTGIAKLLDDASRNTDKGRKVSESDLMETLCGRLRDPEIGEYCMSGKLFVDCLDYKGILEASETAIRVIIDFVKSYKIKKNEETKKKEARAKLKSAVEQLAMLISERVTHYSQKMRSLDLEKVFIKLRS